MFRIRVDSALRTATVRAFHNNALRTAKSVRVWKDGSLRGVSGPAAPSAVAIQPDPIVAEEFSNRPVQMTAGPATAVVTGGSPPFSYEWQIVEAFGTVTIDSPRTASTTFSALVSSEIVTATVRCTVTNAQGVSLSADAQLYLRNTGGVQP